MVKIDLHVHTEHSDDCYTPIKEVILAAKAKGLDGVAITDHNKFSAIKEAQKLAKGMNFLIIPGMEISTKDGHVLALGIKRPIKRDLSAEETIKRIHKQGGLAIAAHPYAFIFHHQCLRDLIKELRFDAIEVFNSANPVENTKAIRIANEFELVQVAGSDAHMPEEVGRSFTIADCNLTVKSFLSKIKKGDILWVGRKTPISSSIKYKLVRAYDLLTNKKSLNKSKNR